MPIKKIPNNLNTDVRRDDAVLSVFTYSKKGHFSCTEAKLFENLEFCLRDTYKFYQVHLTTHPFIAVHVTGNKDKISVNGSAIRESIIKTLNDYLDIGNVKI